MILIVLRLNKKSHITNDYVSRLFDIMKTVNIIYGTICDANCNLTFGNELQIILNKQINDQILWTIQQIIIEINCENVSKKLLRTFIETIETINIQMAKYKRNVWFEELMLMIRAEIQRANYRYM